MGLYESLLGNSGLAISDSTAPSYYNPSLLRKKGRNAYNLSASSFGIFDTRTETEQTSSLTLTPNYLGNIIIGESLNHEIFLHSSVPSRLSTKATIADASSASANESERDFTLINFGYSMAFRSIPFALSYVGEYVHHRMSSFTEFTSLTGSTRSTNYAKSSFQGINLLISASGYFTINSYTMGYNFKSRRIPLYRKTAGEGDVYLYDPVLNPAYQKIHFDNLESSYEPNGQTVAIGHGFKAGDHEFLTDSILQETSTFDQTYKLTQTFGYRMNSASGHQFLCGFNHLLGSEITYLGQSTYYSVGYSWLTRSLRSAIGAYYYSSKLNQDVYAAGLSFGSEFSY